MLSQIRIKDRALSSETGNYYILFSPPLDSAQIGRLKNQWKAKQKKAAIEATTLSDIEVTANWLTIKCKTLSTRLKNQQLKAVLEVVKEVNAIKP